MRQDFKSFVKSLALQAIQLDRGKMSQGEYIQALKVVIGENIFEEVERILDKK